MFPEPESVIQDNNAKKLDNLLKAQQLGANPADLQEELNESEIFKNEMELEPQGMGGMEGEEESDLFDYTQNDSSIKADSDNNFKEEEHPRDEDGKFAKGTQSEKESEESRKEENNNEDLSEKEKQKEIQEKIEKLKEIDWTKDNILPNLNKDTLNKFNLEDKPILLKKNIIEKNKLNHPDITEEEARRIIGNALYKPETILKANPNKPTYHNFISRTDDKHSDIVLLELSDEKENYEVINYHIINNPARDRKVNIHKKS